MDYVAFYSPIGCCRCDQVTSCHAFEEKKTGECLGSFRGHSRSVYFQELNGGLFRTSGILLGQQSRPCPVDVRGTRSCCYLKHSVEPGMSLS